MKYRILVTVEWNNRTWYEGTWVELGEDLIPPGEFFVPMMDHKTSTEEQETTVKKVRKK